jgi:hypothetical protein
MVKNGKKIKVIIKKCHSEKVWYSNNIGDVFEIDEITVRDYCIVQKFGFTKMILRVDAEEIKESPLN